MLYREAANIIVFGLAQTHDLPHLGHDRAQTHDLPHLGPAHRAQTHDLPHLAPAHHYTTYVVWAKNISVSLRRVTHISQWICHAVSDCFAIMYNFNILSNIFVAMDCGKF